MGNEGKIILDNCGGVTLQMGEFAHYYDEAGKQAADDLRAWLGDPDTSTWDGHEDEAAARTPSADEIRNGGYRVIRLDRDVDTAESLAAELRAICAYGSWGNADDLADALAAKIA